MSTPASGLSSPAPANRGVLAPADGLERWLHVVFVVLLAGCSLRYVLRHGMDLASVVVLAGAGLLAATYGAGRLVDRTWWSRAWVLAMTVVWAALMILAPAFAWTAVPLAFAALRVLDLRYAVPVVVVMTAVVTLSWLRISGWVDPALIVGPVGLAAVTVIAYVALEREAAARQQVLDDLVLAHDELVAAQRRAGVLAERARLSREIHDSVGQGLSSINLLLHAADREWSTHPERARGLLDTAGQAARDGLDEVRRVVADLAPAMLDGVDAGHALPSALRSVVEDVPAELTATLRVDGTPSPVSSRTATALLRTVRGALANAVEHARAESVAVTLTYREHEVCVDVRDDGIGFTPGAIRRRAGRGTGLDGIRARAAALGGRTVVRTTPGQGTTVSITLPRAEPPTSGQRTPCGT